MDVDRETLAVYAELAAERHLPVRVYVATALMQVEMLAQMGIGQAFGGPWLRIGAVKGYADGSLSSGTAYFFEPYRDLPESRGLLSDEMVPEEGMRARLLRADERHLQICVHAIGDAAISRMLDLYGEIVAAHGSGDRRWRIEHAQHMAAPDFDRFARLGVIAVGQPGFVLEDSPWAEARLGHDRSSRSYAYRSFLDHGVRLAVSTDWPVVALDPMNTIFAAATRATAASPKGWFPEQRISVEEALTAYTVTAAYAESQEADKGTLIPGKLADFVIVDPDPLAIQPALLRDVKVLETWVGGERRYVRDISGRPIR
jgi:predicted amidohydrolase YtcJ